MKKNIIYTLFAIGISGLLAGCLPDKEEDALIYKGPTVVEFKNFTLGQAASVLTAKGVVNSGQTDSTRIVLLNTRGTDSVLVQLIGEQRSTPTVLSYTVRTTSTAVEGTNYNFRPAGARTVTIPANSSSAYILLDMIPNSFAAGITRTVAIDLLGNSEIAPTPGYKKFIVSIRR